MKIIFYLAAIGWVISFGVSLISLAGQNLFDNSQIVFVLHIGSMICIVPSLVFAKSMGESYWREDKYGNWVTISEPFRAFENKPYWMPTWLGLQISFAIFIILYSAGTVKGTPDFKNGIYGLFDRGDLIRQLSEQEYDKLKSTYLLIFTGIWMILYGVSAMICCPSIAEECAVEV